MTYDVFKWCPRVDAEKEIEPLINIIQFGDGVEQRQKKGLRSHRVKFSGHKFVGSESYIDEIEAFVLNHLASPFYYTLNDKQYLVRIDGTPKKVYMGANNSEITLDLVEVVR